MQIETRNPATGEQTQTYNSMSAADVDAIAEKNHQAWLKWRDTPFHERSEAMKRLASLLLEHKNEYAEIIANEMGKPVTLGRKEIEKCAWVCEFYAEQAEQMLASREIVTDMSKSMIHYRPIGTIFAIMPWNYPFWQVLRFAAPNIMAGNAAILSHAPICTGTGLTIEKLFVEAGFPEHLFRTVIVDNDVAAHIIGHDVVRGVTLTGSARAGAAVGAEAGKALKKVVLELGGSDPYVILKDADIELAAEQCIASRLNNSGQVCISAKRIIAVDDIRDQLEQLILEKFDRYKMGNPLDDHINFGPMARGDLRDELHKQVQDTIAKGAECLAGGVMPEGPGYYYPPTMLRNVKKGMVAYHQELFGPVVAILPAKDEAQALEIANDSEFGLGGAVFTQNIEHGIDIATNKIHTGTCYVNGFVSSDPRLPFGGIKNSGYGRELATEGIHEFMNIKTVAVK